MKLYEVRKNTKINIGGIDFIFRGIDGDYAKWDNGEIAYSPNTEVILENGIYFIEA